MKKEDFNPRHIVLFSGGLDSLSTALVLTAKVIPEGAVNIFEDILKRQLDLLYVNTGTKYSHLEYQAAKSLSEDLSEAYFSKTNLKDLSAFEHKENAYIPYRNLFLAAAATAYYEKIEADSERPFVLWMGGLKDDDVPDKSEDAFKIMSESLSGLGRRMISVRSLWWDFTKVGMVESMIEFMGDEFLPLAKKSISCYKGNSCGECPSCFRKYVSLKDNGISCEDWFEVDPRETSVAKEYQKKIHASRYDPERRRATLRVLEGGKS